MKSVGDVHWHEGLFMQPQHLQMMQRNINGTLITERRERHSYSYGVIAHELSDKALEGGQVIFDRLKAVMPNGLYVDIDDNTSLPSYSVLEHFKANSDPVTLYLALPEWISSERNVVSWEDGKTASPNENRLYVVSEVDCADENTGEDVREVLIRKLNARIMPENDDFAGMTRLPICRVVQDANSTYSLDFNFGAPMLYLIQNSRVWDKINSLQSSMITAINNLKGNLTDQKLTSVKVRGQLENLLLSGTLNSGAARLKALLAASYVCPFQVYLELVGVAGQLAATGQDIPEPPPYDHDNPSDTFGLLCFQLQKLIAVEEFKLYSKLTFATRSDGIPAVTLGPDDIKNPIAYYLAVTNKGDGRKLTAAVEKGDSFKLLAPSQITGKAVAGIELELQDFTPQGLPARNGCYYFAIDAQESNWKWQGICQDKSMAVVADENLLKGVLLELYMILPEEETKL